MAGLIRHFSLIKCDGQAAWPANAYTIYHGDDAGRAELHL
jgi:hypothetical protein